jgi:hypothetical protein
MQSKEKQQEHHTLGKYTIVLRIAFETEATHGRSLVDFLPRIRKGDIFVSERIGFPICVFPPRGLGLLLHPEQV